MTARNCKLSVNIDRFTITADPLNYIVTITKKLRARKDGSKVEGSGSKFFCKIPDALNYILEQKVKDSDAKTIQELVVYFQNMKAWVQNEFKELERK